MAEAFSSGVKGRISDTYCPLGSDLGTVKVTVFRSVQVGNEWMLSDKSEALTLSREGNGTSAVGHGWNLVNLAGDWCLAYRKNFITHLEPDIAVTVESCSVSVGCPCHVNIESLCKRQD